MMAGMKQQSVKGRSLGTSKLSNARLSKSGFTLGRKGIGKSELVKSQSKSKDFTQGLL